MRKPRASAALLLVEILAVYQRHAIVIPRHAKTHILSDIRVFISRKPGLRLESGQADGRKGWNAG